MYNILLVEDSELISTMVSLRLQMKSYTVDCAFNGREGYKKALAGHYHAVLLDMHMPIMDGHQAAKTLRDNNYTGLIIAVTASVRAEETQSAIASGCDHFIAKPIGDDFENLVAHYISEFVGD